MDFDSLEPIKIRGLIVVFCLGLSLKILDNFLLMSTSIK